MYFYGWDYYATYILFLLPAMIISLIAQIRVKSAFSKYSGVFASLSGAQAAQRVLDLNGVSGVRIERVSGNLTDHFDPRTNVIRLSDSVYDSRTIAAVGVAAHEAGHAVQYAKNYAPIKVRGAILPVCNFGSQLSMPLVLIGLLFGSNLLAYIGVILFSAVLLFQLVTLPVEFDASHRALDTIRNYNLLGEDGAVRGAKKVLTAAAMTYVAAVITSIAQLLRLLTLVNNRRN